MKFRYRTHPYEIQSILSSPFWLLTIVIHSILYYHQGVDASSVPVELNSWYICDSCGVDIFNIRFHCGECRLNNYDLCPQCYQRLNGEHFHKLNSIAKYPRDELLQLVRTAEDILRTAGSPSLPLRE